MSSPPVTGADGSGSSGPGSPDPLSRWFIWPFGTRDDGKSISAQSDFSAQASTEQTVSGSGEHAAKGGGGGGGGCPVRGGGGANPFAFASFSSSATVQDGDGKNAPLPASVEEAASHPQIPRSDQRVPLSTVRTISSIPRGSSGDDSDAFASQGGEKSKGCAPSHQPDGSSRWVYPSEQQLYNAMRRKGWDIQDESTVPHVLRIHNAVNERGWAEVRRWEKELHGCDEPQLVRFLGRPKDTSPRAWFNSRLLMYRPPFDRHDWYVDRGDGSGPKRYVIDFYEGNDRPTSSSKPEVPSASLAPRPPAMYLDVRPALDDPGAVVDRARMFFRDAFPGIFAAMGSSESKSMVGKNGGKDSEAKRT
eukprot:CAMPEP_0183296350 /NCGR_PEP_ID=MMETSP0160_2-20130417/3942_1 /TAXON_ID=2839 ORGANISM="Odontella Sinensis, Strain Grunow 1884" /NCGR_SAMPLE_ID=MMETSP0160_2 /ASSEMBLY_ACC=CAM_ASM_000250 /LENGTH=361 /DNA_ID=CAMNT_0025457957 /DNA_START=221 /DNA_END=1306 /DNA_ORIENTATION=-